MAFSPVSGASLNDLDRRRLRDYFEGIRQQDVPADGDTAGWETLLFNTKLMSSDGIALGGTLLFGVNPKRFLPQSSIEAVAYPGLEQDYNARERVSILGAMTPLYGQFGIVETGLVAGTGICTPEYAHGNHSGGWRTSTGTTYLPRRSFKGNNC